MRPVKYQNISIQDLKQNSSQVFTIQESCYTKNEQNLKCIYNICVFAKLHCLFFQDKSYSIDKF